MTAITNPFPLFSDTSSRLIDGARIYVGLPDQDPEAYPANVFWDAALTIAALQPLRTIAGCIVNSGTPSRVYVSGDYSLRVRQANGVTVFYSPRVTDDLPAFIASLAASDGSSKVGFKASGGGAVTRTMQDKARDTVSATDFGAKGNGTADDTAAIQAAIDSLQVTGGTVEFPTGIYRTLHKLTMRSGVSLRGFGRWVTYSPDQVLRGSWISYEGPTTEPALYFLNTQTITLSNMGVACAGDADRDVIQILSNNAPSAKALTFEKFAFVNFNAIGWGSHNSLTPLEQVDGITFRDGVIVTCRRGFVIDAANASDYSVIERVGFDNVIDTAFDLVSPGFMRISECAAGMIRTTSIMFKVTGLSPDPLRIHGCQSEGVEGHKFLEVSGPNDQQIIDLQGNVVNGQISTNSICSITASANYFNHQLVTTGFIRWEGRSNKWDPVDPLSTFIGIGSGGMFSETAQRNAISWFFYNLPRGFVIVGGGDGNAGGYRDLYVSRAGIRCLPWVPGGYYDAGNIVQPSADNGHAYRVTVAGTVGTEPVWPTGSGATITSGGVTFQEVGPNAILKGYGAIQA